MKPTIGPLQNRRIVVTRAEEQSGELIARLRALGAAPIACPAIMIVPPADFAPLDAAIARLSEYDWLIVTSANGVRALLDRMAVLGQSPAALAPLMIGAIGPATAQALAAHGLHARFVPTSYVAEAIVEQIGDVAGRRVLLPRADIAREALAVGLRERGRARVYDYRAGRGAGCVVRPAGVTGVGVIYCYLHKHTHPRAAGIIARQHHHVVQALGKVSCVRYNVCVKPSESNGTASVR